LAASALGGVRGFRGGLSQQSVGNSTNQTGFRSSGIHFSRKTLIGTGLELEGYRPANSIRRAKRRKTMFGSNLNRHLIALFGAFLMSTVAVSAAVGPIEVQTPVSLNA
jgi:hypothetical protein